jgi:hypothetical protein
MGEELASPLGEDETAWLDAHLGGGVDARELERDATDIAKVSSR